MDNYISNTIKYAGKKYTLTASLFTKTESNDIDYNIVLDNSEIELIEFSNGLNDLYVSGSLVYIDRYGYLDKLINSQYGYCNIIFNEHVEKNDSGIRIESYSKTNKFVHDFYINKIEILERDETVIKYKLSLVSSFIFNLISNISYTNWDKEPEDIFTIIKNCIKKSDLTPDVKSFTNNTTNVKLNYITNGNDNILTICKFLLNRLYYYSDLDNSLKFIFFDVVNNNYKIFDLSSNIFTGFYGVNLSMFKSSDEIYTQGVDPLNFATVTKFPNIENIKNLFNFNVYKYDINKNLILCNNIKTETITNYINNTLNDNSSVKRFTSLKNIKGNYIKNGSYWANDINIYNRSVDSLLNLNSLIINTSGYILRQPAGILNINIDRDINNIKSNRYKSVEEIKKRYKEIEGKWIISKVRHIINPTTNEYRQNLVLIRNFKNKN